MCNAQSYLITTVAGGGSPLTPAPATSVSLGHIAALAADAHGGLYFAASTYVFKMDSSGTVTRIAGSPFTGYTGDGGAALNAELGTPKGIAVDSSGNVYIADSSNNVVRKVSAATGIVTTVAGTGTAGMSGDSGPAASAQLSGPAAVAVDGTGNIYIADTGNNVVRKVTVADGTIATVAGNGETGDSGDGGLATSASVWGPLGLALDSRGNLYILDGGARVREVTAATGIITTVAGNGLGNYTGDGGAATIAGLGQTSGVAVDGGGNIYISTYNNVIRKVAAATGIITTVAGNGTQGYSGDGGPAAGATLNRPSGVAADTAGDIYIADTYNNVIREVPASTGFIATVAGNGTAGYSGDGHPATTAQIASPARVALDSNGNFYIADSTANVVRKVVSATGMITTVAGNGVAGRSGDGGPATQAELDAPMGIAVDGAGNIYIADSFNDVVRKVSAPTGTITTVAGNGTPVSSGDGGPATSAGVGIPAAVTLDGSGNLYIADFLDAAVRKVAAATGIITTVAGTGVIGESGDGGPATSARIAFPSDVAMDPSGNLYIIASAEDSGGGSTVRKVAAATGIITTIAGNGIAGYSGDGGPATAAELNSAYGLALDGLGNIYIADSANNAVRFVSAAGIISTIAGKGEKGYSGDGGPAAGAQLDSPSGVAVDSSGNVYIADSGNSRVRLLVPAARRALLSVTKSHTGNFTLGQTGATYSVTVSNAGGAGSTSGTVTLSETIPEGMTLQSMSGGGWSCDSTTAACTRSDALGANASYQPITVAVNVASNAPSQATNLVTLAGGGAPVAAGAADTTEIQASTASVPLVTTVSAASGTAPVTADSIVSMYAANIASGVFVATAGPPAPLPTTLGGVSATITDSASNTAPISLIAVTPNQVNAVLPASLAVGEAVINLVSSAGTPMGGKVTLQSVAPSLFTADESGAGVAAAQEVIAHQDGSQTFINSLASCSASGCVAVPISLGSSTDQAVLELFGTGIRGAGGAANVTVTVGDTQTTVLYAGAQGGGGSGSYYGLDQVNVLLPRSLAGAGTVDIVLSAGALNANTVTVDIQ